MTSLTGVNVIQVCQNHNTYLRLRVDQELSILSSTIKVSSCRSLSWEIILTFLAAILYKSLGIDPNTILALTAVYGTIAFLSNCITTKYLTDQWGRRKYARPPFPTQGQ